VIGIIDYTSCSLLILKHWLLKDGESSILDNSDENEIEEMFFKRLYHLKQEIQAASPKHGEKAYQAQEHIAQ
jgi:hypothetical protein